MKLTVLLDNGHGKDTAGKRSPKLPDGRQLLEWQFTRSIVDKIIPLLEVNGIKSVKLVPEDNDISLNERVKRTNDYIAKHEDEKCIFVSVHGNAAGMCKEWSKASGWECFTTKGQTISDELATFMYEEAKAYFKDMKIRTDNSDGDPDKEANFAVIKGANCAAVLTENGFYDNLEECQRMLTDEFQEQIAHMHFVAILKYFNKKYGYGK